jgi:hypothetical protein
MRLGLYTNVIYRPNKRRNIISYKEPQKRERTSAMIDELDGPTLPGTDPDAKPLRKATPEEAALIERTTQKVKEPKPPAIPPPVTTIPIAHVWDKRRKKRPPKS